MATATLATAAGAAALYYYTKYGSPWGRRMDSEDHDSEGMEASSGDVNRRRHERVRPIRAPSTWLEALATLMETLRFTYSETLGKWPIVDLAFGINFLLRRQGHFHVATVFAGDDCFELKGPDVVLELKGLLRLLNTCLHFSKKPFAVFLELMGFSSSQILLHEGKAALLKPAFVVLRDDTSESILLVIRGTHSIKDTLTAVTGAVVPFHHTLLDEGGVKNLVLGYAHCGMVAAARWIAQLATPHLLEALQNYPHYQIKIVGHSLGGGTAALLTYILRERKEFSSTCCVTFAPAACMTWDLAESGTPFITSVINGSDLVPTFSPAAADDLRAEVTASAWVNDFREQIERTRILRTVFRSATAVSSRLPSLSNISRARVGVTSAWRPVSNGTQVVMRQAQNVALAVARKPSFAFASWSCMGTRRRTVSASTSANEASSSNMKSNLDAAREEAGGLTTVDSLPTSDKIQFDSDVNTGLEWLADAREANSTVEVGCSSVEQYPVYPDDEHRNFHLESVEELSLHQDSVERGVVGNSPLSEICREGYGQDYGTLPDDDHLGEHDDHLEEHATAAQLGEEYLWQELEQELNRQREESRLGREEEQKAAEEIIKDENNVVASVSELAGEVVSTTVPGIAENKELSRFFPPGRLVHMVCPLADESASDGDGTYTNGRIGLFQTSRVLYGKIRLSRTMVLDHYMPVYKRTLEQLIEDLEKESSSQDMEGEIEGSEGQAHG